MDAQETKTCRACGETKSLTEFGRCSAVKSGLRARCKSCCNAATDSWRARNPGKLTEYEQARYAGHKAELVQKQKRWRAENRELRNAGLRERYGEEPVYRLTQLLRNRLYQAISGRARPASAVRDLGCTVDELKAHLEKQFRPGMTWNNWGREGWHIDHIKPLVKFDLADRTQLLQACHYTNLQPLWATENLSKGDRYDG